MVMSAELAHLRPGSNRRAHGGVVVWVRWDRLNAQTGADQAIGGVSKACLNPGCFADAFLHIGFNPICKNLIAL